MKSLSRFVLIGFILLALVSMALLPATQAQAADPVVRAVLFYSPTCPHCIKVMNESLPPIQQNYRAKLAILAINVAEESGMNLYQAAIKWLPIPQDKIGVPAMIVGNTLLVGEVEIPGQLPGMVDSNLAQGGLGWPAIPGLDPAASGTILKSQASEEPISALQATPASSTDETTTASDAAQPGFMVKFAKDPVGNSIAVVVLIGMIISLGATGYRYLFPPETEKASLAWLDWAIPVLCLVGLGVAGYLSYVEIFQKEVVCLGGLHGCQTVQTSQYAYLWGVLPVGVLGLIGYIGIGGVWLVQRFASLPANLKNYAVLAIWGMAIFGVLFSIYLTFLEPFVIGATCTWCIASAITITLIMLLATGPAIKVTNAMGDE